MTDKPTNFEEDQISRHFAGKAAIYEELALNKDDEHAVALNFLISQLDHYDIRSVLDAGAGVGTDLLKLKAAKPGLKVTGCEPVQKMREIGHSRGLSPAELVDGNITSHGFPDKSFDCVCEFAVLHHVKDHRKAVNEMLRVAKKAVFISDSNCFGTGSATERALKQGAHAMGLWPLVDYLKSGGKRYYISEGDGLFYSYSTYFNYQQLLAASRAVYVLNTKGTGVNPYRNASHTAMLAILK
jgi:ubiquinone/menaquinone biosynthesis C-methylase UbiE